MMLPLPRVSMAGRRARTTRNGPLRFAPRARSKSSIEVSDMVAISNTPAAFTTKSGGSPQGGGEFVEHPPEFALVFEVNRPSPPAQRGGHRRENVGAPGQQLDLSTRARQARSYRRTDPSAGTRYERGLALQRSTCHSGSCTEVVSRRNSSRVR